MEAAQIASKQVDCAQRRVFMPSGALYPYPIPEVFGEPLEVYAKAVASELRAMKLKEAAKTVEDGIEETLTYCDFPSEHWTCIRTNNVIE